MTYPQDIQDMIDDFAFLSDWEERYMHVIDLGKALPPLNETEKTDINKVKGCVSQVWLVSERDSSDDPVTLQIFSGRKASLIKELDASAILKELDLEEHLSPQRSNGLKAMIGRIKAEAVAA
jgi:cysteine desulfuration protein SufE